jgi:Flagellar assembly protein T, middle domain
MDCKSRWHYSIRSKAFFLTICACLAACSGNSTRSSDGASRAALQQVTTQGSASVAQLGQSMARQAAIDQAGEFATAQLRRANGGNAAAIADMKVVDEWQDGDLYHVQLLAVLSSSHAGCVAPYRKRIVATGFPMANTEQLSSSESQDLLVGIPREIDNLLLQSGDYLVRSQTGTSLYVRPDQAPEIVPDSNYSGSPILDIARHHEAQFVLSGVIRDFRIESGEYLRGSGLLAEIKSTVRDMVGRRSIGIDVYVHDGLSGALLFQHRYSDSVMGDISLPTGYNVGSERFNQSPIGHSIDTIIHNAAEDIRQFLACYPYETRVIKVEQNRLIIAGGAQDKIKVGDRFQVYPTLISGVTNMSLPSASSGTLVISEVSAAHAVGVFDGKFGDVRSGDWVKIQIAQ